MKRIKTPKMSEVLKEYMEPYNLSAYQLAKDIRVPVSRIQDILHDRRKMTADTSVRLGKYFDVSPDLFINIQNDIDIRNARLLIGNELNNIRTIVFEQ